MTDHDRPCERGTSKSNYAHDYRSVGVYNRSANRVEWFTVCRKCGASRG